MKHQNESDLCESIKELRTKLDKNIKLSGFELIRFFLSDNFALSGKDSELLIQLFDKMIPGLPFDATPEEWYLNRRRRLSKMLTDHIPDMKREYPVLKYYAEQFQKLSDELQAEFKNDWPDELWNSVTQRTVGKDNRSRYANSPSVVAKEILAYRYDTTYETVNGYLKMK